MNTNFYLPEDDSEESLETQELAMQFTVSAFITNSSSHSLFAQLIHW